MNSKPTSSDINHNDQFEMLRNPPQTLSRSSSSGDSPIVVQVLNPHEKEWLQEAQTSPGQDSQAEDMVTIEDEAGNKYLIPRGPIETCEEESGRAERWWSVDSEGLLQLNRHFIHGHPSESPEENLKKLRAQALDDLKKETEGRHQENKMEKERRKVELNDWLREQWRSKLTTITEDFDNKNKEIEQDYRRRKADIKNATSQELHELCLE